MSRSAQRRTWGLPSCFRRYHWQHSLIVVPNEGRVRGLLRAIVVLSSFLDV